MRRRLPFFSGRLRHLLLPNTTNPLRPISVFPILYPPLSSPRRFSSSTLSRDDGVSLCCQMWIDNFRHPDRVVTSISPLLRRFDLWLLAYQKVATDDTGSYVPRSSISTSTLQDLLALRNAVLDGKFKWGARLKFFVKSPRDKTDYDSLSKRKIKTILTTTQPSPFQDKIVQEVLLMILEPIYEPRFSPKSYAFRPGRTPHTVLRVIRRSFAGYLWYIKADFSVLLDGMKVGLVINAVMRDVRDKLIVDLIKDALVTPVVVTTRRKKRRRRRGSIRRRGEHFMARVCAHVITTVTHLPRSKGL